MTASHFLTLLVLVFLVGIAGSIGAWGAVVSNSAMIVILCFDAICEVIKEQKIRGEA